MNLRCIWDGFGVHLLLSEGLSRILDWQPLGSFFPSRLDPSGDGKLGMFSVVLCLLI